MRESKNTLRVHSYLACSYANGPSKRAVIWLQGCSKMCRGCFNPSLKDIKGGNKIAVKDILKWLISLKDIEGISISGGEPTSQMPALLTLLKAVRKKTCLSVLVFSGYTIRKIQSMPGGNELISLTDVLLDGPYDPEQSNPPGVWPSSKNQKMHFLTRRYSISDFSNLPICEVIITQKGEVLQSGLLTYFLF
ncbi:MAG: 4Fe-4S single cluster domain-containing protein [Nitrospirota bacterium]